MRFILGCDAGGSQTRGRIEDLLSGRVVRLEGGPASLNNEPHAAVVQIGELVRDLLCRMAAPPEQTMVVCGVAGSSCPQASRQLRAALPVELAESAVLSDARTSLIGAGGGEPVVMAAIGTGSVAGRLDHLGKETYIGGWGFDIADEGSGAAIGKAAIRRLLAEIDEYGRAQSLLARQLSTGCGATRSDMQRWLGSAAARRYAALAPEVFALAGQCPEAKHIIAMAAAAVECLIIHARADTDLPVVLLGGVGPRLADCLSPTVRDWLVPAWGSALDGACLLARHLNLIKSRQDGDCYGNLLQIKEAQWRPGI